jgi:hypothetical protein
MHSSTIRLHSGIPMAWEDVDTLRFGFDRPEARVRQPSAGIQRCIALLRSGVPEEHLAREAGRAGVTPQQAAELVTNLEGVLHTDEAPSPRFAPQTRLRVLLCDDGREVTGLRDALIATKLCALESPVMADMGRDEAPVHLVVLVERYLEPLERAQKWLIEEKPHLSMRFSDRSIVVGPLVGPDGNPCHTCTSLGLLDQDAALPLLASQLYGHTPASETEAGSHMAVAWAAVLIRQWMAQDPVAHTTQIEIPITHGLVAGAARVRRVSAHPKCACSEFMPRSPLQQ